MYIYIYVYIYIYMYRYPMRSSNPFHPCPWIRDIRYREPFGERQQTSQRKCRAHANAEIRGKILHTRSGAIRSQGVKAIELFILVNETFKVALFTVTYSKSSHCDIQYSDISPAAAKFDLSKWPWQVDH